MRKERFELQIEFVGGLAWHAIAREAVARVHWLDVLLDQVARANSLFVQPRRTS